jgi:PKD domain-containing protein
MKLSWLVLSFSLLTLVVLASSSTNQTSSEGSAHLSSRDHLATTQGSCPILKVSCPDSLEPGNSLKFTASVEGGDQTVEPTYNWTVSAGAISSGQGTSTIEVDTSKLSDNETVTATVELGGFDPNCKRADSCTTTVIKRVDANRVDEYPNPELNYQNSRLDAFAKRLQQQPENQAYILVYGGRRGVAGEARASAARAKDYLVKTHGIDAGGIVTADGGYKEAFTVELWIVPPTAMLPPAEPTVDPKDVELIKPTTKRSSKRSSKKQ